MEFCLSSGMMGYSYGNGLRINGVQVGGDDHPLMCFNAAKSYQLGWYDNKAITLGPLLALSSSAQLFGIVDYENEGVSNVLLKLESGSYLDYYINFNRMTGFNNETQEGGDQILLTSQGANGERFSKSTLLAKLSNGGLYNISDYGGSPGTTVQVAVTNIDVSAIPAYAIVEVMFIAEHGSIFLNCGGNDYYDGTNVWKSDEEFFSTGGKNVPDPLVNISDTTVNMEALYQSERYGPSMKYQIGCVPGYYGEF